MNEGLEKFRELLLTDETFQKKLQDAAASYTGEQTEGAVFNNVLAPLAAQYGIRATYDEFKEYIVNLSTQEMSSEELAQVAGGDKFNGGGVGFATCKGIGGGAGGGAGENSGGACLIIGVGWNKIVCLTVGCSEP